MKDLILDLLVKMNRPYRAKKMAPGKNLDFILKLNNVVYGS